LSVPWRRLLSTPRQTTSNEMLRWNTKGQLSGCPFPALDSVSGCRKPTTGRLDQRFTRTDDPSGEVALYGNWCGPDWTGARYWPWRHSALLQTPWMPLVRLVTPPVDRATSVISQGEQTAWSNATRRFSRVLRTQALITNRRGSNAIPRQYGSCWPERSVMQIIERLVESE
jgi:hypothetical protein